MKTLDPTQRRFIVDMYRDGHTQASIASMVGSTQGNISQLLAYARRCDPSVPIRPKGNRKGESRRPVFASSQLGSSKEPFNLDHL
jgi:hypothetical protein